MSKSLRSVKTLIAFLISLAMVFSLSWGVLVALADDETEPATTEAGDAGEPGDGDEADEPEAGDDVGDEAEEDSFVFTDVAEGAWYYEDVRTAWENGLIDGMTPTTFAPDENLTYAQAVKLAACMRQLEEEGDITFVPGEVWYQVYVDYAREKGIIGEEDLEWSAPATRAGYMEIFAKALPDEAYEAINDIEEGAIPDVPADFPQAEAIYKLYISGIVQGVGDEHLCNPESNIKRSEVATILTRMVYSEARIAFSLAGEAEEAVEV